MEDLNFLILALLASGTVGTGVSLVIQIGKLYLPSWFPDGSADNWRLGLIVGTALVVTGLQLFGVFVDMPAIEKFTGAFAALGATLMPLFVLFAGWIAKQTYNNVLKGIWKLGVSHTKE